MALVRPEMVYAVHLKTPGPEVESRLTGSFPSHYKLADNLFLVRSRQLAVHIKEELGIDHLVNGVVFKLNESYTGFYTSDLWDWMGDR